MARVIEEPGANPEPKEVMTAEILAMRFGLSVRFLKPVNKAGIKTPDALFGDGSVWESKVPEAYHGKTVKNQFKKALGKGTDKLLISGVLIGAALSELVWDVCALLEAGEFTEIREVLVLPKSGELVHIKRGPLLDTGELNPGKKRP